MREAVSSGWVYFMASRDGARIKVGYTKNLAARLRQNERRVLGGIPLVLLAAVVGTKTHEKSVQRYFQDGLLESEGEWFGRHEPLVGYINWLRQQWWTTLDLAEPIDEAVEWDRWLPLPDRVIDPPPDDPTRMIQLHRVLHGDLAGTPWDTLATPEPIAEDYYTPVHLVAAAYKAMGGIDLDPASHWRANREFRISTFYHLHRSAFDNPWFGRVWLNPPYGDNAPWFARIAEFWDKGEIDQLCMLSPVWAFATKIARPIIDRSAAMLLLHPTPTFWGNPNRKSGTNHPHMILYMGAHTDRFHEAFADHGIPFQLVRL